MQELLLIGFIVFMFWFWKDSMSTREIALSVARRACADIDVQFLDDTVSVAKLKLCRNQSGTMALCRLYTFEFSQSGEARYLGRIYMKSLNIKDVILDTHQVIT